MGDKVVRTEELRVWLTANEFDIEQPVPPPPATKLWLAWPCDPPKTITQRYGINPQWYTPFGLPGHEGIDFRALMGTPLFCAAPGVVSRVELVDNNAYGVHARVKHAIGTDVYESVYGHAKIGSIRVALGQAVDRGDVLALADNTGNSSGAHLHLTLKHYGHGSPWMNKSDIINPTAYFPDLFPGDGWIVDIVGNLRTEPADTAPLIRTILANRVLNALEIGGRGGDWWRVKFETQEGWFWNPGYKLRPAN